MPNRSSRESSFAKSFKRYLHVKRAYRAYEKRWTSRSMNFILSDAFVEKAALIIKWEMISLS